MSGTMTDTDRINETVLALLYLGLHDGNRAWKGFDWDAMGKTAGEGVSSQTLSAKLNRWP